MNGIVNGTVVKEANHTNSVKSTLSSKEYRKMKLGIVVSLLKGVFL